MQNSSSVLRCLVAALGSGAMLAGQQVGGCPMFPKNNVWNVPINHLPVHSASAKFIENNGPDRNLHPDFSAVGGIPYDVVPGSQPKVHITFGSPESDPGPYPIPPNVTIEAGPPDSDTHAIILQQEECKLYEIYQLKRAAGGDWTGGSGAVFDLRSNALRPDGWTSADAAGLPILAGLVRFDEIAAGEIKHAIRLTVPKTRNEYIWPARHFASRSGDPGLPAMGQRFRLKATYDISGFPKEVQVLLVALKKYGMILSDNGSSWFLTGSPDKRWNDELWAELKRVKGTDIEAVDTSSLQVSPNSGQAGTLSTVGLYEVPFSPTPVFDLQGGSTQTIQLSGDVGSSEIANASDGQQVSIVVCQDETGGRAFMWPSNVRGGMRVGTDARTCSAQTFVVKGNLLFATSVGVRDLTIQ
jgi:hypothetical protein